MLSKEEAKEAYIREELNFLKGDSVNEDIKEEAMKILIDNALLDEAVKEYTELAQKYSVEVINPLFNRTVNFLKYHNKEEALSLFEELREKDKRFLIRGVALEDFFETEKGSRLSESDKIDMALKLGALIV